MVNLAMTDNIKKGWPCGRISSMPGGSSSGKTILILSSFSEACNNPFFDEYDLYYDDVERRCDFNMSKLFPPLVKRLKTPSGILYSELESNYENTGISNTIQQLESRMTILSKKGKPFIYISDSMDAYTTDEELEKSLKTALERAKTEDDKIKIKGSFHMEKAKILGQILRMTKKLVAETNSIFIMVQQLRQNSGATMPGQSPWKISGGEAPYFYSHVRPWLTKIETLKNKKEGGIQIGVKTKAKIEKNSVTGKLREVVFPIYYDLGIDDNGAMVDYLLKEKYWESGSWIEAPELDLRENGKDKLVRKIEELGLESKLKRVVQKVWNQIEDSLLLNRKSRY